MTSTYQPGLIRDLDPTDPESLYCGYCGMDYSDMTVDDLANMVRRGCACPACCQYLEEFGAGNE